MENLADLERKYEELGKEIERLKEQQNGGRVKEGRPYFWIDAEGVIGWSYEGFDNIDNRRFNFKNYFKTEEEAKKTVEKIEIYNELKRLAERLNNGVKINWNNCNQSKYNIEYHHESKRFYQDYQYGYQGQGTIFCLDINFKDIAIEEIGEDRLRKLFE